MAGRGRSWGSGGGIAAASSVLTDLLVRYERYKNNNCRSNTPIPSAQVVSATVYADAAALAAAFPAAANAGKMGKVTSGSSYVFYTSNGSAYTLNTTPTVGYLNPGSATPAGYKVQVMGTGIVNARPANGGAQLLKPVRLYGAFPYLSGSGITKGVVQYLPNAVDASEGTAARGGRYAFVTEDVYPAVFIGGGNALQMTVDDGSGPRRVVDPTLSAIGPGNCAFIQTQSGGIYWTTLDFSQLGGRKRRYVEFPLWGDFGLVSVGISSTATFFDPPNHPLVLHLADSLGGTVSQGASCEAYSEVMRDVLGNPNWWLDSESGTGFLAGNRTHRQKIANLSTFPQLKAVALGIMALSVNDGNGMAVGNFTAHAAGRAGCLARYLLDLARLNRLSDDGQSDGVRRIRASGDCGHCAGQLALRAVRASNDGRQRPGCDWHGQLACAYGCRQRRYFVHLTAGTQRRPHAFRRQRPFRLGQ